MVERVITATTPCLKFVDVPLNVQIMKVMEEVGEVRDAWVELRDKGESEERAVRLMEEMLDVQACINTMFEQLAKDYGLVTYTKCRTKAEEVVIRKNLSRGYYAEDVRE